MYQSNISQLLCVSILFFSSLNKAAEGYMGALPPSSADIDKVLSVLRTCMSDPKVLRDGLENLTILPAKVSKRSQEDGNLSTMLNGDHHTQMAYSMHLWEALIAGAEKFKELNWVVLPQQQGKVVTLKKWEDVYSKDKKNCYDKRRTCEDTTAKKIGLAISSKGVGVSKHSNLTINCLREGDANLLEVLIDNKYTYNPTAKKWENPKSASITDPEDTKKTDAADLK